MRELTAREIEQVSGGSIGGIVTSTLRGAAVGGVAGTFYGAAWGVGFYAANSLREWLF